MGFKIYKNGQGKYTRLYSAFGAALVVGLGCWRLYLVLEGNDLGDWISTMVPVAVFLAGALLIYWLINKPTIADFMISAEGEMKKVSWSSRGEIMVSTVIVIAVVVLMAALIGFTDLFFQMVFGWLLS